MDASGRITLDPAVCFGRPAIRGMRITVGTIVRMVAAGMSRDEILKAYPMLEPDDITGALQYAASAYSVELRPLPAGKA